MLFHIYSLIQPALWNIQPDRISPCTPSLKKNNKQRHKHLVTNFNSFSVALKNCLVFNSFKFVSNQEKDRNHTKFIQKPFIKINGMLKEINF